MLTPHPVWAMDTLRTDLTTAITQGANSPAWAKVAREAWGKASVSFVANGLTTTIETDDLTDLKKSPLKFKEEYKPQGNVNQRFTFSFTVQSGLKGGLDFNASVVWQF